MSELQGNIYGEKDFCLTLIKKLKNRIAIHKSDGHDPRTSLSVSLDCLNDYEIYQLETQVVDVLKKKLKFFESVLKEL